MFIHFEHLYHPFAFIRRNSLKTIIIHSFGMWRVSKMVWISKTNEMPIKLLIGQIVIIVIEIVVLLKLESKKRSTAKDRYCCNQSHNNNNLSSNYLAQHELSSRARNDDVTGIFMFSIKYELKLNFWNFIRTIIQSMCRWICNLKHNQTDICDFDYKVINWGFVNRLAFWNNYNFIVSVSRIRSECTIYTEYNLWSNILSSNKFLRFRFMWNLNEFSIHFSYVQILTRTYWHDWRSKICPNETSRQIYINQKIQWFMSPVYFSSTWTCFMFRSYYYWTQSIHVLFHIVV